MQLNFQKINFSLNDFLKQENENKFQNRKDFKKKSRLPRWIPGSENVK